MAGQSKGGDAERNRRLQDTITPELRSRAAQKGVDLDGTEGAEALATLLAREPVRRKERARRDVLEEKFPTAALAVLDFDIARWRDLAPGEGKLVDFVRPRDL